MVMTGVHASYAQDASGSDGESAGKKIMMVYDPAILTNENPSAGEKNAYDYFNDKYVAPEGYTKEVLSTSFGDTQKYPADPSVVKCIWVHIDRDKNTTGWRQLPEAYTSSNFINKLRAYLLKGGNIYLSGQATELVVPLWRVNTYYSINHVEQGRTHVNENDPWKITVKFNSGRNGGDNSSHPVFDGLLGEGRTETEIALFEGADTNDRSAKWKICDDQGNALFNFRWNNEDQDASSLERFEYDNLATVLASYNWDKRGQYATMVELHPLFAYDFAIGKWEKKSGSIITNSIGAYDFSAGSDNNLQGNIEKLTGNILTYLSGTPNVLVNQYPYYSPAFDGLDETIESTGRIALYIDCDSKDWEARCKETKEGTDGVLKYEQEIAAYNYFMDNFVNFRDQSDELKYRGAPAVVFKDQMDKLVFSEVDKEGFECIWVNCDRDGLYKDENGKPIEWEEGKTADADFTNLEGIFDMGEIKDGEHELITKLMAFTKAGGNLYLTKWANLMLGKLGRTDLLPNQVTNLPKKDQTDKWGLDVLWSGRPPDLSTYGKGRHKNMVTVRND